MGETRKTGSGEGHGNSSDCLWLPGGGVLIKVQGCTQAWEEGPGQIVKGCPGQEGTVAPQQHACHPRVRKWHLSWDSTNGRNCMLWKGGRCGDSESCSCQRGRAPAEMWVGERVTGNSTPGVRERRAADGFVFPHY